MRGLRCKRICFNFWLSNGFFSVFAKTPWLVLCMSFVSLKLSFEILR